MSAKNYRPCKPYRLNTIGVCLFGRPYFPEEQDVCPREWYTNEFEGKTVGWRTDASFEHLQSQVEHYLRFVYPRLNTARITLNWAFLLAGFFFGVVFGFMGLFIIFLLGDKSKLAFKEMCKRAFDLEIEARQQDVPPEGREGDIIAHHLVCSYSQTFQKLSWSFLNPISWFNKFGKLQNVPKFCEKNTGVIMEEYELWNDHKELAPVAAEKAVEMLSRPRSGGSTRYICLFLVTLILFVTSVLLSIFLGNNPPGQPEVSLAVGCSVIGIFILLSFLYLLTWIPVARKVAGLVRPSTERWAEGTISKDPIDSVTDLGMLSILVTELNTERMYVPSMMYWHNVAPALSDEPPQSAKGSLRSLRSGASGLDRLSMASAAKSEHGDDSRSLPGSPANKRPAAAGLAAIRASQAFAQGHQSNAGSTQSPRFQATALRGPPSTDSSSEGAVPGTFDGALKGTVVEPPVVEDLNVAAQAASGEGPQQAATDAALASPRRKVHFV